MAVTVGGSGTQTATINTEHTLLDVATSATFQFAVDTTNMAAGDYVELRVKMIFKTSGTLRVAYFQAYSDAQDPDDIAKIAIPISNALADSASLRFTLKQTKGTGRAFDWQVLKFA